MLLSIALYFFYIYKKKSGKCPTSFVNGFTHFEMTEHDLSTFTNECMCVWDKFCERSISAINTLKFLKLHIPWHKLVLIRFLYTSLNMRRCSVGVIYIFIFYFVIQLWLFLSAGGDAVQLFSMSIITASQFFYEII